MTLWSTILRAPFERRARREAAYLALTLVPAILAFALALAAVLLSMVGVGLLLLPAFLSAATASDGLFRGAARRTVGWTWPVPRQVPLRRILRDGDAWRSLLYCGLKLPLTAVGAYGALVGYVVGALAVTYPLWWVVAHAATWPYGHRPWTGTWLLALEGAGLLLAAPWFVRLIVTADRFLVEQLLAPSPTRARIAVLEASRETLADDATTTLRRIERDLHDGTQARLVALGVALSRLEARAGDAETQSMVAGARQQVLDALDELREIIRGVHPPALDHGLSTALATVAARSAVPVELHDELQTQPTDAQAAALYFTAAELLTNITRHAQASHADIVLRETDHAIVLSVSDDGRGGAAVSAQGSGLAGIERRIRALDGTLRVDSPVKGPSLITVTLPKGR